MALHILLVQTDSPLACTAKGETQALEVVQRSGKSDLKKTSNSK